MTTYPLDKFSYFLFQDSASEVSYSGERIIIKTIIANNVMNMNKMASVLAKIYTHYFLFI